MNLLEAIIFGILVALAVVSFIFASVAVIAYLGCKREHHVWGEERSFKEFKSGMIIVASWHKCENCGKEEFYK